MGFFKKDYMNENYYNILGVEQNAPLDEIKKSYKKLVKENHPDKFENASEEVKKEKTELFKKINEAYTILSDEKKRKEYDFSLSGGFNFPWGNDFFNRGPKMKVGKDIMEYLYITLKESYLGGTKPLDYYVHESCPHCNGTGQKNGAPSTCPHCNGSGMIMEQQHMGNMFFSRTTTCPHCKGTGKVVTDPCEYCNGLGLLKKHTSRNIDFPPGIYNNIGLLIKNGGDEPEGGGVKGDLNVVIRIINDEVFERNEDNLIMNLPISIVDAWNGGEKEIQHISGENIKIIIPELSKPNDKIIINNKGFENPLHKTKGDFIININYITPDKITEEQKNKLKDFFNNF